MRKLQILADHSPFGIFHTDVTGAITYANDAWSRISGISVRASRGRAWWDVVHPRDRARVLAAWIDGIAERRCVDFSCRLLRPDNERRFVRISARSFPVDGCDAAGNVACAIDITDQVMAERRLRKNNQLLSAVLENIPCGVTVYDADGSLLLDNQQFRHLLSLPAQLEDAPITDFGTLSLEALPQKDSLYLDTGPDGAPAAEFDAATRVREEIQPDGRVLEVRDARMPAGGLVSTYTDITQHKQIIESLQHAKTAAEQAAAAKAAFLAVMSHEIRTPLNGVIGLTNVLLNTPLADDQRELLEDIWRSGESLMVVINDVLDYSKIESGQMQLEWIPLSLKDVINGSVRLLSMRAQERGLEIAVAIDKEVPALVYGDRTRLQQVLVNLLSNAVKFTETGQISLSVSLERGRRKAAATGDLCAILVRVQDTGIGITQDKLRKMFEPFVQADTSTARRYGGTGLGLAITKRLVAAMGGSVSISSEVGAGTTVTFSFVAETAAPESSGADNTILGGRTALIVVWDRAEASMLVRQLKRWNMVVETCGHAGEALSLLEAGQKFDLILCDAYSADMNCTEFARRLRSLGLPAPILLSPTRLAEVPDAELIAALIPRGCSEAALYQSLSKALGAPQSLNAVELAPERLIDRQFGARIPLRILVAEDNDINRKVAVRMLRDLGYEADVVRNGREVTEAVRRTRYDVVLMDIQMPEMDGIQATQWIGRNLPLHERPRIIAVSANVMREEVEAALEAGCDDYIGKPVAPATLRAVLEQCPQETAAENAAKQRTRHPLRLIARERVTRHLGRDGDSSFLEELVDCFMRDCTQSLQRIRASVHSGCAAELRSAAHELAGIGAVIGAEHLTQVSRELEGIGRRGTTRGAAALTANAEGVLEDTVTALQAFLSSHSSGQQHKTSCQDQHGRFARHQEPTSIA